MRVRQMRQTWQKWRRGQGFGERRYLPLLPLLPLLAACGGAKAETASKPTMRDSAGVTIVDNTAPVWPKGGGWTLTPRPTASIGMLDGAADYQLFQVSGAVRLSDGTIVVANGGTKQLRFYDATGHFVRSVGREGGGPGEFKQMAKPFRFPGDTIGVFDWSLQHMSLFTPQGDYVRSIPLTAPGGRGFLMPISVFSDGTLLVQSQTFGASGPPASGEHRDSITFVHVDRDGGVMDTVGTFRGQETLVIADKNMIMMTMLAFGRGAFAATHDTSIIFGNNDSYAFEWLDRGGHAGRIVRRAQSPVPLTDADVTKYKTQQLANASSDNERRFDERMFAKMPFPETIPAYKDIAADALGDVWVQAYAAPGDTSNTWAVFNPDGWLLGSVALPYKFSPDQIGRDYILGTWKDENDVEHVMEYGIRKPEAARKEGA